MPFDFDRILDRRNTGSLKWDYVERVLKDPEVIPMWVADLDFASPPAVVDAVRERAAHPAYGYPMTPRSFWQAAIEWQRARHGWDVKREWLAKAPGVVPSLNLAIRAFTQPGEKVVIQTPVYFPFYTSIENNGRRIVRNPLRFAEGRWTMDLEDLERRIDARTRMLILCSPHNPVGRVWTEKELRALADVCCRRDLVVVSDEIHAEVVLKGRRHVPLAKLGDDIAARTITLVAPSKCFNLPGLATSLTIASNPRLLGGFVRQLEDAGDTMGNIFGIVATEAAYRHGGEWLDEMLAYVQKNVELAAAFAAERLPRIKFLEPEGTYLALLDCRGLGLRRRELEEFFTRKAKVYFNEGHAFGEELEGFVRMNLACPRATLEEALTRIERALSSV